VETEILWARASERTEEIPRMSNNGGNAAGAATAREHLLSPEMATEIAVLIARALDERDRHQRRQSLSGNGANNGGSSGGNTFDTRNKNLSNGYDIVNASGSSLRWNPEDIGFFEPDNSANVDDYEYQGKTTIWRNVYLFMDAFQFNAQGGRETEETQMWLRCFRRLKFREVGIDIALNCGN